MALVPIGDNVILKRLERSEVETGEILIELPDSARPAITTGKVLAIGDGRLMNNGTRKPVQVNEGDRVMFDPCWVTEINLDGQEYIIIPESAILGVYQ